MENCNAFVNSVSERHFPQPLKPLPRGQRRRSGERSVHPRLRVRGVVGASEKAESSQSNTP